MIREDIVEELRAMVSEDRRVRAELAADGSLYGGYHPRMREVHDRNAARLHEIWADIGWPGRSIVGDDGSSAAWLILQHAIGQPEFQRAGLIALKKLALSGEVDAVQVAMLEDRICAFEGRPQLYGTQFDRDESGLLSPLPLDDRELVDARRAALDMPPLSDEIARHRAQSPAPEDLPPFDYEAYQAGRLEWLKQTGWRAWE